MTRPLCLLLPSLLMLGLGVPAPTRAAAPPDRERTQRLAAVGKLWGTVRTLHPYLAYKDIDWDAALVKALPKVMAARTVDEYASAVDGMLGALGDPATCVVRRPPPRQQDRKAVRPAGSKLFTWVAEGTLAIDVRDPFAGDNLYSDPAAAAALRREVSKAR